MKPMFVLFVCLSLFVGCSKSASKNGLTESIPLRGVWLTNVDSDVLFSDDAIREAVQFLDEHNFNVIFPVVWNDAKTLFPSQVMEKTFGYAIDPRLKGRDPLKILIEEAHARDMLVIPWFEYGFSSSFQKDGGHLLKVKPEWAARDNQGRLLKKNGFEWMNPYHPEVQEFIISIVEECVRNYDVDGVQGDDRLPAQPIEGGYSDYTIERYKKEHNGAVPPQDYRNPEWQRWRGDILNAFGKTLCQRVKTIKPDILVTWAPSIYPWSFDEYLQDWPNWLKGGYGDWIIPQVYRYSSKDYQRALAFLNQDSLEISAAQMKKIIPGVLLNVGEYVMDTDFMKQTMDANRAQGFQGEVFFFYEGLRKNNDQIAKFLKENYYQEPLKLKM
jgi:uncharacterized lipoprotein YddW (UPF0748 family)